MLPVVSSPTVALMLRRCSTKNVCSASTLTSLDTRQFMDVTFPIFPRYDRKYPWPVKNCVVKKFTSTCLRFIQSRRFVHWPVVSLSQPFCHLVMVSFLASCLPILPSRFRSCANRSIAKMPASTSTASYDTVKLVLELFRAPIL